jgi:hypothetical protein
VRGEVNVRGREIVEVNEVRQNRMRERETIYDDEMEMNVRGGRES